MFGFLQQFAHKAEMRESKDEMLVGEIVRAMARQGYPSISFRADGDQQRIRFLTVTDPVLFSVYIRLDRKTGQGVIGEALIGSKATLTITAEIRNQMSDPDDLVKMYKTDLANIFKMPVMGGIKLNHELNRVYATTTSVLGIEDYIMKGDAGAEKLAGVLQGTIGKLKEKLEPYKRS